MMTFAQQLENRGFEKGFQQGLQEGLQKARQQINRECAEKMLLAGLPVATIVSVTSLNPKEVEALK